MAVATINGRDWALGRFIGGGGFGKVYAATSGDDEMAVKLVPKHPLAEREILFAKDLRGVPHVVPVLGVGETATHWAILMPLAEQSLEQSLKAAGAPLAPVLALPILIDIAEALGTLSERGVVHRDLKPGNILRLGGQWSLADFGISRYVDATTVTKTLKRFKSSWYAAPEQWREERATPATDVYAFGVIAYEMLAGSRPFAEPGLREKHLHEEPPRLSDTPTLLAALVEECLIKAPGARPTPRNLVERLRRYSADNPTVGDMTMLAHAHRDEIARRSREARQRSQAESAKQRDDALFVAANQLFESISSKMSRSIKSAAPSVEMHGAPDGSKLEISLHETRLTLASPRESDFASPFRAIAHAYIAVSTPDKKPVTASTSDRKDWPRRGRAHSLWYCDAQETGQFAWFETAFVTSVKIQFLYEEQRRGEPAEAPLPGGPMRVRSLHPPLSDSFFPRRERYELSEHQYRPFPLVPDSLARQALLYAERRKCEVAWPFTSIRPGEADDFIRRWANWLALAARGQADALQQGFQGEVEGSWRRK